MATMRGIAAILETGRAPGINTKALDPGCPRRAVPRALRELEIQVGASAIARGASKSVKQLRSVWLEHGTRKRPL